MAKGWFRLPETEDFDGGKKPDLFGYEGAITRYWATKKHLDGAPIYVVKIQAPVSVLNNLANEPRAKAFEDVPKQALDGLSGENISQKEWDDKYR